MKKYEEDNFDTKVEVNLFTSGENEDTPMALSPLANTVVDAAIDNMTRKLIAGYRNKNVAKPNAKEVHISAETQEAILASSAQSVMDVANRGQGWKELITKSFTAGISSLSTIKFDGQFSVKNGMPENDFQDLPNTPGVYVVFDQSTPPKAVYVGDSGNMRKRWYAGHLNEYRQGERSGNTYKLAEEFSKGCTVKFIKMDTVETAAALEARLIKENFVNIQSTTKNSKSLTEEDEKIRVRTFEDGMLKNKREELSEEQGKRSNIEAKKMKDSMTDTTNLIKGAAGDALKNVGFDVMHRLTTTTIKALKDELIDIFHPQGITTKIVIRIRRILKKILSVLSYFFEKPLQLARGIVQFIVNALSKTISQIYNLASNIFDLANNAWNLYRGAATLPREELVRKISETVIVSGTLIIWDGLDPIIETNLVPFVGPFAPFLSSAVVAIGFGLSSHYLQEIVKKIVDALIAFKQGFAESLDAARVACNQLINNARMELELISDLREYVDTSLGLMTQLKSHTEVLSEHQAIESMQLSIPLRRRN